MKALLALPLLLLISADRCAPQVLGIRGDALDKFCPQQPLDCDDIYAQGYQIDGVYLIYPSGPSLPVPVFCDMTTEGGKWTVSGGGTEAWSSPGCATRPHRCVPGPAALKWGQGSQQSL